MTIKYFIIKNNTGRERESKNNHQKVSGYLERIKENFRETI
jgi:hypothetical protein